MYFSSHLSENQYFSSRKIDENVVFLATTHDKSGLTRRELSCVVTRNETLSSYHNCITELDIDFSHSMYRPYGSDYSWGKMPKKYDFPILSHIQNKKVPEWGKELWYQKCLIPSQGRPPPDGYSKFLHIFCISILSNLQQCTCLMVYIWTYGGTRSQSPWIVGTTFYPTWKKQFLA